MSINFFCSGCGRNINAPDSYGGYISLCPHCGQEVKVPGNQGVAVRVAGEIRRRSRGSGRDWARQRSNYLAFTDFITPVIAAPIYIFGAVLVTIMGGKMLLDGASERDAMKVAFALAVFVGANLAWRLAWELVMVAFRIHERLTAIDENTSQKQ